MRTFDGKNKNIQTKWLTSGKLTDKKKRREIVIRGGSIGKKTCFIGSVNCPCL